ncbi:MAG: archease [Elusimicrobia bacterium]|nr:archease [Elusimicrobiota bacterium]
MSPSPDRWEHFPHPSDVGVRGLGDTKEAAFEQAALAMTAAICDPATVAARAAVDITCRAADDELLLAAWLNALVYEMAARRMLFSRFEVRLDGGALSARAWGEPLDAARHKPAVEVKGATLAELSVRRAPGGSWLAQCVVDV